MAGTAIIFGSGEKWVAEQRIWRKFPLRRIDALAINCSTVLGLSVTRSRGRTDGVRPPPNPPAIAPITGQIPPFGLSVEVEKIDKLARARHRTQRAQVGRHAEHFPEIVERQHHRRNQEARDIPRQGVRNRFHKNSLGKSSDLRRFSSGRVPIIKIC